MENKQLKSFKDLIVWQKAVDLTALVYSITEKFPKSELYGITNQMRRSAVSISSNIAEGFKRNHKKEKLQLYNVAYGSTAELESQIEVSRKLNFLNGEAYQKLSMLVIEIGKMIDGLTKSQNIKFPKPHILNPIFLFIALYSIFYIINPTPVHAATTIYFDVENQAISREDTFIVNLKISTPDKPINVVDGTIIYDNNKLEIKEVSTGGSSFALWPKPPVFSNNKGTLNFVGGVPDGFQDKNGEVLKIIFLAKNKGEAKIDFLDGFSVFLNDGQGTQINPWLKPLSLSISEKPTGIPAKDEWQTLIEKDKTPPEFVEAVMNRDPHLFDNQYFVSFLAVDKDSGVAYYEVKEGEHDFIRAKSPYLLQDQSLKGIVQIKSVDNAGNGSVIIPEITLVPEIPYKIYLIWLIAGLVILAIIFWLRRHYFKSKIPPTPMLRRAGIYQK